MKSAVEKLNPTEAKITVEIPYADLKPFVAETYKQLADQIQIPGFRKGKVPSKLIDQRVGFDFVIENALNEGLNDFYQQALAENEDVVRGEYDIHWLEKYLGMTKSA